MADQQSTPSPTPSPTPSQASSSQPSGMSRSPNAKQDPPPSQALPTLSGHCSGKPKKRPTVTPRTFTRFFTPRSLVGRGQKIGASRQALREISASTANRRRLLQRRTPTKDTVQPFGDENDDVEGNLEKRKRKTPATPDTIPDHSSPLKRIKNQSLETLDDAQDETMDSDVGLTDEDSGKETGFHRRKPLVIDPVESRLYGQVGWNLRRETGQIDRPRLARDTSYGVGTSAPIFLADSMTNMNRLAE